MGRLGAALYRRPTQKKKKKRQKPHTGVTKRGKSPARNIPRKKGPLGLYPKKTKLEVKEGRKNHSLHQQLHFLSQGGGKDHRAPFLRKT